MPSWDWDCCIFVLVFWLAVECLVFRFISICFLLRMCNISIVVLFSLYTVECEIKIHILTCCFHRWPKQCNVLNLMSQSSDLWNCRECGNAISPSWISPLKASGPKQHARSADETALSWKRSKFGTFDAVEYDDKFIILHTQFAICARSIYIYIYIYACRKLSVTSHQWRHIQSTSNVRQRCSRRHAELMVATYLLNCLRRD